MGRGAIFANYDDARRDGKLNEVGLTKPARAFSLGAMRDVKIVSVILFVHRRTARTVLFGSHRMLQQ